MKVEPRTLKGFRDFLPKEARKRQYVIDTLKRVFESYGFEPLETPALEYEDILLGKYGDEGDKLLYNFIDKGDRKVALRYDQTVPLARVVSQYMNSLPMPFKRYQMQNVWRAENTQKGRFREFLQCDADIVGIKSRTADVEIISVALDGLMALGFDKPKLKLNDRRVYDLLVKAVASLNKNQKLIDDLSKFNQTVNELAMSVDKLNKIGEENVLFNIQNNAFLKENLFTQNLADLKLLTDFLSLKEVTNPNRLSELLSPYLNDEDKSTLSLIVELIETVQTNSVIFSPTLARGLDYYTELIFEVEIDGYSGGSVAGGGRYDNLVSTFSNLPLPAAGFAFGFDRLMEAMDLLNKFPEEFITTKVLITIPNSELALVAFTTAQSLRIKKINTEVYLDEEASMEKQFKYAEKKGIPNVVVPLNENEVELRTKNEDGSINKETLTLEQLIEKLQ